MNIKNIIFSIVLCTLCHAHCQNNIPAYIYLRKDTTGNVTNSIVRAYGNNSILYIEKGGKHYFSAAIYDPANSNWNSHIAVSLKNVEINNSYTVNDFKIIDNSFVYYCGKYFDSSDYKFKGFIGFFKISEFLSNNIINMNIYKNFSLGGSYVGISNLSKLEVFYESGKLHIVSIGSTSNHNKACILEIVSNLAGIAGSYNVGVLENSNETIDDIAVTDNYVVTVGGMISSPDAAIHKFSRQNIFSDTVPYDTTYTYPTNEIDSNLHVSEDLENFLITHVLDDIVAIASYWHISESADIGTNLQGTLLRIYNTATTSEPTMMTSMSINRIEYNGNWKLKELDYNETYETFTLLQNTEISQTNLVSLISSINFSGNPIVQSEYAPETELTSLDNGPNSDYNLISGHGKNAPTYFILLGDKINSNSSCATKLPEQISFKSIYNSKKTKINIPVYTNPITFSTEKLYSTYSTSMVLSCERY